MVCRPPGTLAAPKSGYSFPKPALSDEKAETPPVGTGRASGGLAVEGRSIPGIPRIVIVMGNRRVLRNLRVVVLADRLMDDDGFGDRHPFAVAGNLHILRDLDRLLKALLFELNAGGQLQGKSGSVARRTGEGRNSDSGGDSGFIESVEHWSSPVCVGLWRCLRSMTKV